MIKFIESLSLDWLDRFGGLSDRLCSRALDVSSRTWEVYLVAVCSYVMSLVNFIHMAPGS